MKLIITFLLSVVAYTAGSPTCSNEKILKCSNYDPRTQGNKFVETEENLNSFCRLLNDFYQKLYKFTKYDVITCLTNRVLGIERLVGCLVDFREICGETGLGSDMAVMFKQYKKLFSELCDEPYQMRQKYLENAKCLNKEVKNLKEKCPVKDEIDKNDPDFCNNVEEQIDCSYDVIKKKCGEDARDVYIALYPGLDFYGCNK